MPNRQDSSSSRRAEVTRTPHTFFLRTTLVLLLTALVSLPAVPAADAQTSQKVLFGGITYSGPYDFSELNSFEKAARKKSTFISYYQALDYAPTFNPTLADAVRARGATPQITLEPWKHDGGVEQPQYALTRILDGSHDATFRTWARGIKAWGKPLQLRFAHEMNGNWYPWSEGVNGNQSGSYVQAWRYVHNIFKSEGATNVSWVWSPFVRLPGSKPLASFYPGDAYVDWVALDGYNGGTALDWGGWQSFEQIFGPSLAELKTFTNKPVAIAEVASAEAGGNKALWIKDFFAALERRPEIKAFSWFHFNKETDWRITSSPSAQKAFATGISNRRY